MFCLLESSFSRNYLGGLIEIILKKSRNNVVRCLMKCLINYFVVSMACGVIPSIRRK